jgi:DNA invertase Pin-like site-specific DNA recombinase
VRTLIYVRRSYGKNGTEAELLRQSVEDRDGTVIASFSDDPAILGKGKYAGWNAMLANLGNIDQIVVGYAGDLPGRSVKDLLAILSILRDHGVSLRLHRDAIDTDDGPSAMLDLISAYRDAKLSEAIRRGISKARMAGRILGRPAVPDCVQRRILAALANGGGIRPTARRFGVSPASVINIRDSMMRAEPERMAA